MRAAVSEEDRLMEEAAGYFFFAERWGWTPDRVDQLPLWLHDRLPTVAALHDEVGEERRKDQMPNVPGG